MEYEIKITGFEEAKKEASINAGEDVDIPAIIKP
jgi:hypothetical protein